MPYTFQIVFTGLCLANLQPATNPPHAEVLLVNATTATTSCDLTTQLAQHSPLLLFKNDHLDLVGTTFPQDLISPSQQLGPTFSQIELSGDVVSVAPHPDDLAANPFAEQTAAGFPDKLSWIASLHAVDPRITGIDTSALRPSLSGLTIARFDLPAGLLGSRRRGPVLPGQTSPVVWNLDDGSGTPSAFQELSDELVLKLSDLQHPVTP